MNPGIAFEIMELALSLAKAQTAGRAQQDIALAAILLRIVEKGAQAYRDHTGQPLDLSLISQRTRSNHKARTHVRALQNNFAKKSRL